MTATADDLKKLGNTSFQANEFPQAIEHFTNAIALDENNHVLYSNRSAAYASLKDYKLALEDAEKTVELKSDWAKGYSRKGAALYGLENYDEAVAVYEKGLALDPENALLKRGLEDVKNAMMPSVNPFEKLFGPDVFDKISGNPQISHFLADPAVRQKITMIQQNPSLANSMMQDQTMMQIIIGLLGMNMPTGSPEDMMRDEPAPPPKAKSPEPVVEEVISDEETAKRAARASSNAEKDLGNVQYKKRSFTEALVHYDSAFEMDGTNVAVLTNKAAVLFEMQQYQDCIDISLKAAELGREIFADFKIIARAYARVGNAYAKLNDYAKAVNYMEKSLTEVRSPETLEKLRQFEKLKKEGEVEAYHDESLSDAVLALNVNLQARERGNVLFKENKYAEGVKEYTEAIKRNRKDPRNLSNRAACYIKLLALPEADKDCDDAIKIDPTFMKSYIRKASIQFAKKDYKKTIDICNDALLKDTEKKHTAEIEDQMYRCHQAMNVRNSNNSEGSREETLKQAMEDPEVQEILADPIMRSILEQMQKDPKAAQDHMKNPVIYKKLQVLMNAGVLQMK